MPKKPNKKKLTIKLLDLTPKKDARGGQASYSKNAPLSIPPPGFISAHDRTPDGIVKRAANSYNAQDADIVSPRLGLPFQVLAYHFLAGAVESCNRRRTICALLEFCPPATACYVR